MSNPILTVFDDAGNAIAIPAFPWVTEGGGGGGESGGGGMDVSAHTNGATELTRFYGGPASIPELTIRAAFESAVAE